LLFGAAFPHTRKSAGHEPRCIYHGGAAHGFPSSAESGTPEAGEGFQQGRRRRQSIGLLRLRKVSAMALPVHAMRATSRRLWGEPG